MSDAPKPRRTKKKLSKEEIEANRERYGIDDWTKAEKYEYVAELSRAQLKWEFIRREAWYRHRFEHLNGRTSDPIWGKYFDPRKRGNEIPKDYKFKSVQRRGEPLMLEPPSLDKLILKKEDIARGRDNANLYGYMGWQLMELVEMGYVLCVFDPRFPPTPQANTARIALEAMREEADDEDNLVGKKIDLKFAGRLLRALDANFEGVTLARIGQEILGAKDYDSGGIVAKQSLDKAKTYYWKL